MDGNEEEAMSEMTCFTCGNTCDPDTPYAHELRCKPCYDKAVALGIREQKAWELFLHGVVLQVLPQDDGTNRILIHRMPPIDAYVQADAFIAEAKRQREEK